MLAAFDTKINFFQIRHNVPPVNYLYSLFLSSSADLDDDDDDGALGCYTTAPNVRAGAGCENGTPHVNIFLSPLR